MKTLLDATDEELAALAEASTTGVDRIGDAARSGSLGLSATAEAQRLLAQLKDMRDELRGAKRELDGATQTIVGLHGQLGRAEAELAEKTAALRAVDRDGSMRRIEAQVAIAREAERLLSISTIEELRADNARLRSEVDDLRASKKKLREALERSKEGR